MKRLFPLVLMTALLILSAAFISSCGADDTDGSWVLSARNASRIDTLYLLFGSSLRHYGAGMTLGSDGSFSYYLGLTGGDGVYTRMGDTITADVRSYNEGCCESLTLRVVEEGDTTYLVYPYHDCDCSIDIWWEKSD